MTAPLATGIFVLTYMLIASRRLHLLPIGRPGGALLGAVLMVACGILTPAESYAAIDHDTIVVLFAMMMLSVYLDEGGFFLRVASWLASKTGTPWGLLVGISVLSALLSAILLNDTVCVFLTPLVVTICTRANLPMGPYLIALATSANIGSAATLVGNPQNILIGSLSKIGFAEFLKYSWLPSLVGLVINTLLLRVYYYKKLPARLDLGALGGASHRVPTAFINALERSSRVPIAVPVLIMIAGGFLAGLHLAYTALAGVLVLILVFRRDPRPEFAKVEWSLLIFFCALFIVVAGFAKTGYPTRAWDAAGPWMSFENLPGVAAFSALLTVGSQIVSNVPMILLAGPHLAAQNEGTFPWVLAAYASTIAGNLTLIGSVANIIVAETAREHYTLGFREYLKFGAVSTLLILAVGVPILFLMR